MLRHLQEDGINVAELMMRVEDVIIKTILCSEEQIASACKLFMPNRGNCFGELNSLFPCLSLSVACTSVCLIGLHVDLDLVMQLLELLL